jgi:hypothetical protein
LKHFIQQRGTIMKHHPRIPRALFVVLALCFSFANIAFAQEITGSIVGTVKDANGAVVSGAAVTIVDVDKKITVRTATTDDDGIFSARDLPAANYDVTIEAPNFKKHVESKVKLDVGQRRTIDVSLETGNIAEVVTVESQPLQVETQTATASALISGDQVRELSLNNRNWVQLVTLAPGVTNDLADQVYVGTTNPAGQANTINISVNGARSSQNTFTIDGADITDRGSNITIQAYPSVDSIGEFRVLRSLYPAESGSSGGGQVNIITRSGGNGFHGSLFEFVRNEKLNANDFLTNATPNPPFGRDSKGKAKRNPFRYNNFGFTVGGPVYFLKFGEGGSSAGRLDRTFFFFSEEQRRDLRYVTLVSAVPDANLRLGIFPIDVCINRNDIPAETCTGAFRLAAGTPLPASRLNPAAAGYLAGIYNKLPLPSPGTLSLSAAAVNKSDFRQEILKFDHSFTDRLSAFYRYERDKIPTIDVNSLFSSGGSLPGVATTVTDSPGKAHTFQMTFAMSSKTVIEGRYTHAYGAILSHNIGLIAVSNTQVPVTLPFTNTRDRIPSIIGNGFGSAINGTNGGIIGFGPYDNFSNKNGFSGSLSHILGSHTVKVGAGYSKYRKNENALVGDTTGANQGIFTAFGTTLPVGVTSNAANQNLQRWANFLVGNVSTFVQGKFDYTANMFQSNVEVFGQDEWRYRPNLTLYYGLRYSRFGQPYDKNGRLSNFDPRLFNPANAPAVRGNGDRVSGSGNFCNGLIVNSQNVQSATDCTPTISPYGQAVVKTANRDFAPRVGLAWDPFKKGTTSIRAGYGIYHEQVLVGFAEQIIGLNPPYQQNFTISNTRLDNPGAASTAPPSAAASTIRAIDPNWKTPYMQHWSLDVQHQIMKNTLLTVGYYGSKGTHLIGIIELNELPPGRAISSQCATGTNYFGQPGPPPPTVQCQVPGTAFTTSAGTNLLDQIRPYKGYRSITMLAPRYNSNYHSLQTYLQRRFSQGSQLNVAYTWSKNITDEQNDRTNAPENSYDIRSERGRAALDRRHVLSANYIYELPFFSKQDDALGKLLGGWQISGIVTYNSGLPFTVTTSSFDAAGLGNITALVAGNRPNLLCDPNAGAPHTLEQWFNIGCVQPNPSTNINNTPGNAGRGIINGPNTKRVDFTVTKNIRFGENVRLQLRGEAFNIFNWTNFRTFGTNVTVTTGAAAFGRVTAVRDPRTLQFGAKFIF